MYGLLRRVRRTASYDRRLTTVVFLLFFGAIFLFFLSFEFPSERYYKSILLSAILAIITTAILDIGPIIFERIDRTSEKAKFLNFFGEACARGGVTLLFTNRKLTTEAENMPEIWDIFCQSLRKGGGSKENSGKVTPEGITLWLPFQDFRGANYVASEIARVTSQTAYYRTDKSIETFEVDDLDKTIISFGLGFNKFTHTLSDLTNKRLFKVTWAPSARKDKSFRTDNFELPEIFTLPENITSSMDYALVARIVTKTPPDKPTRYFFVCAGRTASGTAAAGYYLSNHWNDIIKLYLDHRKDPNKVSVAIVLEHWFGHDYSLTPDADRDHDCSVKITRDSQDREVIKWHAT